MLRAILSVIAGYVTMFMVVMATFSVAFLALGTERAFAPGSWDPSVLWLVVSFALGLLAAVVGGWVCARSPARRSLRWPSPCWWWCWG